MKGLVKRRRVLAGSFNNSVAALQRNFALIVYSNPGFHWFCSTSLCDWSKKITHHPLNLSGCKTTTNRKSVSRVFTYILYEFLPAPHDILRNKTKH